MDKLNLMRAFVAVVEEGSYTAAAKRIGKTKALVSVHVAQLETALSVRLIQRTTRSLHITDTGRVYYEEARRILDDVLSLESKLKAEHHSLVGRLRMTAPATFGTLILPQFIAVLRQQHPQLQVDITLTDRYVDLIDEGFDAGIRIGHLADSSLIARKVGQSSLVLCASPSFIATQGAVKKPEDITSLPCIVDSNYKGKQVWWFKQGQHEYKVEANTAVTVNSAQAAAHMASLGAGLLLTPEFAAHEYIRNGTLQILLSDYALDTLPVNVVYPSRQHLSSKVTLLIAAMTDFLAQHKRSN